MKNVVPALDRSLGGRFDPPAVAGALGALKNRATNQLLTREALLLAEPIKGPLEFRVRSQG
jgi:hypothetical protein